MLLLNQWGYQGGILNFSLVYVFPPQHQQVVLQGYPGLVLGVGEYDMRELEMFVQ